MLKICFEQRQTVPLFLNITSREITGVSVQTYLLLKELSINQNLSLNLISGDYGQANKFINDNIEIVKGANFKHINMFKKICNSCKIFWLLKKIDSDINVQRGNNLTAFIILIYAKIFKKKSVFIIDGDIIVDGSFEKRNNFLLNLLYKYTITNIDKLFTVNEKQKELIKKKYKRDDAVVLGNGIKINHEISVVNIRQKNKIIWVGKIIPLKNPKLFIRLAREHPNYQFLMILHDGPDDDYNSQVVSSLRKNKNIELKRNVSYFRMQYYYKDAKLLISTSTIEGFPNIFLEAGANMIPILSYKVDPNNFLCKYNCGICSNGNLKLLYKNMNLLMLDEKKYNYYSKNIYSYVKKFHDIKNIAQNFLLNIKDD